MTNKNKEKKLKRRERKWKIKTPGMGVKWNWDERVTDAPQGRKGRKWDSGRVEWEEQERNGREIFEIWTNAKFVKYEWTRSFLINYSKTVINTYSSLCQPVCSLKAVISITVVVNFIKITNMPSLLFLRRVVFNRRNYDVVKWHYCSSGTLN